jgi:hypothetical protein
MRVLTLMALLPLLAGCSNGTWDYLTHFGSDPGQASKPEPRAATQVPPNQTASAAPAGAQPGQAQPPDPFCLAVAREDASENGFDSATEGRMAVRSYTQCIQIFGPNAGK